MTDVARAIEFYEIVGFRIGNTHTPDDADAPNWAWLHCGHAHLMLNQAAGPIEPTHHSASIWQYTKEVSAAHAALQARGLDVGTIEYPFYNVGGEFHVHDPDGYAVLVAHLD